MSRSWHTAGKGPCQEGVPDSAVGTHRGRGLDLGLGRLGLSQEEKEGARDSRAQLCLWGLAEAGPQCAA